MTDVASPHDRFFKEIFSRPDVAENFALNFLSSDLSDAVKPNTFRLHKGSFVDARLREYFSDLLYKVDFKDGRGAFVYILFEHKSHPDPIIGYQLLRYMTRIWDRTTRHGIKPLRPVIPVVLYHGTQQWKIPLNFAALYDAPESVRPGLLDFTYHLCDLSTYTDADIKTRALFSATLGVALLLMKNLLGPGLSNRLSGYFELIRNMSEQTALEFLETVLRYLGAAKESVTEKDMSRALEDALGEKGGVYMESLLDKWMNEGVEQGLQQGLQQGKLAGVASLTIRLLTRRFGRLDESTQERVRLLSLEHLEQLGEDLLEFPNENSLTEWLDRISAQQ